MGEIISANAKLSRVEDHVRRTLRTALARGGDVAKAAQDRLADAVVKIDAALAVQKKARDAADTAWAAVLAEDTKSDTAIVLLRESMWNALGRPRAASEMSKMPRVPDILGREGLLEPDGPTGAEPGDLTREPLRFPAGRDVRLQALARGDEGFLLAMGYSTQRGYGGSHPFAGEVRMGEVSVEIEPPELGFAIDIGDIVLTECQMVNQFKGSKTQPPQFTRGYGLVFGFSERKAMSMALVDRALRAEELGEDVVAPAQNVEFVLYHSDNIEATGFVEHLKLPHYVDFQSELQNVRRLRAAVEQREAAE